FMTVGDCVQKPQVGELAEALVSLDPITGARQWWHQRRLVDVADLDIGNSPTVVDIDGTGGCHLIVSIDKDSCIYGFPQPPDVPVTPATTGRKPELLATVGLPAAATPGGGGPAIVDGRIYVPVQQGIAVVGVDSTAPGTCPGAPSCAAPRGNDMFHGPYPEPFAPGAPGSPIKLKAPYD